MPTAEAVTRTFPIGALIRPPARLAVARTPAWRVDTQPHAYFLKSVQYDEAPELLRTGVGFERAAFRSGIPMPEPIAPAGGLPGDPAEVEGVGWCRLHRWVDLDPLHRLDPAEVSDWLGRTLATIARISPRAGTPSIPIAYGPQDDEIWSRFAVLGESARRPWAAVLRERLGILVEAGRTIRASYAASPGFAFAHPDVEVHNVGLCAGTVTLTDWDFAAPDSVPLVVAHAALNFAVVGGSVGGTVDVERIRRTVTAYREAGGAPLAGQPGLLSRRLGMMLTRLAERLKSSLRDASPAGDGVAQEAVARLEKLPDFIAGLRDLERAYPLD